MAEKCLLLPVKSHCQRINMGHGRQKLELDPTQPNHSLTETAVGYRLLIH